MIALSRHTPLMALLKAFFSIGYHGTFTPGGPLGNFGIASYNWLWKHDCHQDLLRNFHLTGQHEKAFIGYFLEFLNMKQLGMNKARAAPLVSPRKPRGT